MKIAFSKKAVRFVDAGARKHWTWKLAQTGDKKLTVTFARGSDTYTFVARIGKGRQARRPRSIHPVTKVVPSSSASGPTNWVSAPPLLRPRPLSSAGAASGGDEGGSHGEEKKMTDDTPARAGDIQGRRRSTAARTSGPARAPSRPQKRRGVAAGRIAAAGVGLAAMAGLVANMEVASGKAPAQPAPGAGPDDRRSASCAGSRAPFKARRRSPAGSPTPGRRVRSCSRRTPWCTPSAAVRPEAARQAPRAVPRPAIPPRRPRPRRSPARRQWLTWRSRRRGSASWRATPTSCWWIPRRAPGDYARRRLEELEQRWSRFLPASDVSRLNETAGGAARGRPTPSSSSRP